MIDIRASSLPELFDCPARFEAKQINKIRMPSSGNAILGKAVHASTAYYDAMILEKQPITPDDAAGVAVDTINKPEEDVEWGEDSPQEAEGIAIALHKLYCYHVAPKQNYVAVEAKCERLEIIDLGISLTGTTDRVVQTTHGYCIADIKTGKTAVRTDGTVTTQGHAAQMAVYELLAERATGLDMDAPAQIIGLQVAKTDKGRRSGVGTIAGGRELLLGDEYSPGLLQHAAGILKSGAFFWNPRSMLCSAKYCPIYPCKGCR